MHAYCTEVLGLTDAEAYNRIEAARAGQRYPRVFEMLLEGSLSLTTVQLVARRLTEDTHAALLAEAADKTKSQVQHLLARWFPQPDVPASTRKKFGLTDRPRASRGPKDDADISASVKRAVWIRDRGCCAFVSADGRRCGSRRLVQFHHHGRERCEGGKGTVDNIQLRCAAHNRYESSFADGFPKRAPAHWATRSGTSARPHMEPRPKRHELAHRPASPWRR